MSDVLQANEPEARTATGEIKDQGATAIQPTPTTETKPPTTDAGKTQAPSDSKDTSSLLNKDRQKDTPSGAPEKYEAFKVPEGHEIKDETAKEVNTLFKDLNLTQDQGQKLVDYWVKNNQEAFDAPFKAWEDVQAKWVNEVKLDPDMGHRLPEIKATIGKAMDSLGDPKLASAFRDAMDYTGAGNNPAFIKAFWKLAQAVTEGGHVSGKGPSAFGQTAPATGSPTAAKALYPNLP